jgi:hypothetical protein
MTKPTLCICDQQGSRPACASLTNPMTSNSMDPDQTAQAGRDPCWSQTHYVVFVMARLKCNNTEFGFKALRRERGYG